MSEIADFQEHGLVIKPDATWEQWLELWSSLDNIQKSHQFWLGDALNAAKEQYGEQFSAVVDEKYIYQLTGPMWVCSKIPLERRKKNCSYSLHKELAALEPAEQDRWLNLAEAGRWTVLQLKAEREVAAKPSAPSSTYPSNGAPPDRVLNGPPPDVDMPDENWTEEDEVPETPDPEPVRDMIDQLRAMDFLTYPRPPGYYTFDELLEAYFGKDAWSGDPLLNTDRALLLRPRGWRIEISETDRGWNVRLSRSGSQIAIAIGPHLPSAIIEAVLASRIST